MKAKWKISFPYFLLFLSCSRFFFVLAKAKEKNLLCVYHRRYSNAALTTRRACHTPSLGAHLHRVGERRSRSRLPATVCAALTFSFLSKLKISDNQAQRRESERLTGINLAEATAKLFDLFEFLRRRGDTNKTFSGSILLATPFL